MARPVSPRILFEEFTDYETLLSDMTADPTPITLPCIPQIAPENTRSTANKRNRGNPTTEGDTARDIPPGTLGRGTDGTATGEGSTSRMAQGATPVTTTRTRAEQITAFLQNPMMPGPHQVKLEHITYLLALILGGEVQEAVVHLLMPAITPEHALAI